MGVAWLAPFSEQRSPDVTERSQWRITVFLGIGVLGTSALQAHRRLIPRHQGRLFYNP